MKTLDSFMRAYAKLPERGWKALKTDDCICLMPPPLPPGMGGRLGYCGCPVTAVAGDLLLREKRYPEFLELIHSKNYERAAQKIDLETELREAILAKADNRLGPYEESDDQLLRIRLLRSFQLPLDEVCYQDRLKTAQVDSEVRAQITRYKNERKAYLKKRKKKK